MLSLSIRTYFQERLRNRLYDLVIKEFEQYQEAGHNQVQLANRLGKRSEQISRWLSSPGNLTLDTVSDLLLGLSGAELGMTLERPAEKPQQNPRVPDWLAASQPVLGPAKLSQCISSSVAIHTPVVPDSGAVAIIKTLAPTVQAYAEMS